MSTKFVQMITVGWPLNFLRQDQISIPMHLYWENFKKAFSQNVLNRKDGNDQETIQLPNTFRSRLQRERKKHLKQRHHNQNTTSKNPKGQFKD